MKNLRKKKIWNKKGLSLSIESNWNFLIEKGRPQNSIPSQTFLNENRFSIKLTLTSRPEIPISSQTFLNEIRFRIKFKVSEWKMQAKILFLLKLSSTKFDLVSNWLRLPGPKFLYLLKLSSTKFDLVSNWLWLPGQKFLYLLQLSSTKFDLESNWKFLNENAGQKFYSVSNYPQRNSI